MPALPNDVHSVDVWLPPCTREVPVKKIPARRSCRHMNKVRMLLLWCFLQTVFLELYIKLVLGAREKPLRALSEAFQPLLQRLSHTEFGTTVLPSAGKMLKRNPEIVMEAVGLLLTYTSLDLSKYTVDLLPTILLQARHNDEARRKEALVLVTQLVLHSSDLDAVAAMFQAVKSVMLGMLFILPC